MTDLPNNLYSNIKLLAPDGQLLSKVPAKRARWYLKKNLATSIDANTLQLNFEPSGRRKLQDWYLVEHQNRCIVCGQTDPGLLEKHHIVPACFRVHLPEQLKDKRCFDLALLCCDCHDDYEFYALELKDQLIDEAGVARYESSEACRQKRAAVKAIKSLLNDSGRMNEAGLARCRARVVAELGTESFTQADMDRLTEEISTAQAYVFAQTIKFHQPYDRFIVRWRKHFLAYTQPKFIDPSWIKDIEVVE